MSTEYLVDRTQVELFVKAGSANSGTVMPAPPRRGVRVPEREGLEYLRERG